MVEPLSVPTITHSRNTVLVQYKVAFFEAGFLGLAMPEIQLIHENGTLERISGDTAWVRVVSVLPQDTMPAPKPSYGPMARERKRTDLVVLLVAVVVVVAIASAVIRRRAHERPKWRSGTGKRAEAPVVQWMNAGESRAVVSAVADRLRDSIAAALPEAGRQLSAEECLVVIEQEKPEWPLQEIARILRSLDRARFAPAVPSDIVELAERSDAIALLLRRSALEDGAQ